MTFPASESFKGDFLSAEISKLVTRLVRRYQDPSSKLVKITFGYNSDEEGPCDDLSKPRKVHDHSKWKTTQDAVYCVSLAWAQEKGLWFWQTNAVIVYNSVRAHCIHKVISQTGERTFFERLSTPPPAPEVVLTGAWQSQQQQQQQDPSESASSRTRQLVRGKRAERDQGNSANDPESSPLQETGAERWGQLRRKSLNLKLTSELKELH